MAEHEHTGHGQSHYVRIWAILLVLLMISIAGPIAAPHIEGWLDETPLHFVDGWMITIMTAFGIAIYKAFLVAANFMHLNIEKRYISYLLGTMLMLMVLFFFGVSPDVMRHQGENWVNVAAEDEIDRALKEQDEAASHGGEHHEATQEH